MWLISLRSAFEAERRAFAAVRDLDALVFIGAMRSSLVARAGFFAPALVFTGALRETIVRAVGRRAFDVFAAAFLAGAFAFTGEDFSAGDLAAAAFAGGFFLDVDFAVAMRTLMFL
jgi:hypothetical protein